MAPPVRKWNEFAEPNKNKRIIRRKTPRGIYEEASMAKNPYVPDSDVASVLEHFSKLKAEGLAGKGEVETPKPKSDLELIREALDITIWKEFITTVTVIAVSKEGMNQTLFIPVNGIKLGPCAFQKESDSYLVAGLSHLNLGNIPFACKLASLTYSGIEHSGFISLPEAVIEKYLSSQAQKGLKAFKEKYANKAVTFSYIQSVGYRN